VSSQPPERDSADGEGPRIVADASRRTRLANERTYLAWWRTGLAALAVAIGVGKIVPLLAHGATWPYTLAGVGFAALGIMFIGLALTRHNEVERALAAGEYAPPDHRLILALTLIGVLLGLLLLVTVATTG
jgi:putative membrane protein